MQNNPQKTNMQNNPQKNQTKIKILTTTKISTKNQNVSSKRLKSQQNDRFLTKNELKIISFINIISVFLHFYQYINT